MRNIFWAFVCVLASFWSPVKASACTYSDDDSGPSYNYWVYKPGNYGPDNLSLVQAADFVGVVSPYIVPNGRIDLKPEKVNGDWYFRPNNLAWKEVQFRLLDVLKGQDDWNATKMYPFVNGRAIPPVRNINRTLDFGFWETLKLTVPKTKIVGSRDSCGEIDGEERLLPDRNYLIAVKGSKILFALVVDGPTDPLVEAFKDIANDTDSHALRMTPAEYFGNMAGYVHFKMKRCAATKDLFWQGSRWDNDVKRPKYDKLKKQRKKLYEVIDSTSPELPLIDVREIRSYGMTVDRYYDSKCDIGDEYLAITRPDQDSYRGPDWISPIDYEQLPHRFLLIENGQVNVDKFLSNIEIEATGLVSVEDVKAWIRAGEE